MPVSEALRRRRDQVVEPTFDRLMRAARELFTDDGFAATSLDAVAAACGVTKGSLYHHFSGKTELFEAVFEEEARVLCERVVAAVGTTSDPWEGAHAGVRAFLECSQDPAVQRIMLLDAVAVLGWGRVREIEAEYGLALVKGVLSQLAAVGAIGAHHVESLAHLLFGALCEGALLIAQADDADAARERVEAELRALVEGLAA